MTGTLWTAGVHWRLECALGSLGRVFFLAQPAENTISALLKMLAEGVNRKDP